MYFAIFDPYDERYDSFLYEYNKNHKDCVLENNDDGCLICLDTKIKDSPKRIHMIETIISSCDCNIIVHERCLYEWLKKTQSCPICRETMEIDIFERRGLHEYLGVFVSQVLVNYLHWALVINMILYLLYNFIVIYQVVKYYKQEENDI